MQVSTDHAGMGDGREPAPRTLPLRLIIFVAHPRGGQVSASLHV